tara:strand:- start:232 stop:474 length:243 start_codon:yes stop_codon:yes gene_type:complete
MGLLDFLKEFFAPVKESKTEETEQVRARDEDGRFVGDDPSTPENEAYTTVKKSNKGKKYKKGNSLSAASAKYINGRKDII